MNGYQESKYYSCEEITLSCFSLSCVPLFTALKFIEKIAVPFSKSKIAKEKLLFNSGHASSDI
jgi:hypothetical protein